MGPYEQAVYIGDWSSDQQWGYKACADRISECSLEMITLLELL